MGVVVTDSTNVGPSIIVVDSIKIMEIMNAHNYLRTLVHRTYSNLPSPPVKEKVDMFMWRIVCWDYCINHSTIN